MIPRFLIADTADIGEARVFVTHTQYPRFIGELFIEDDEGNNGAPLEGVTITVSETETVAAVDWIEPPEFDPNELIPALRRALRDHDAIRGGK